MEEIHAAKGYSRILGNGRLCAEQPTFQQQQPSTFLGHSLQSLYKDVLKTPVLVHLQAIAVPLEPRTRAEVQAQDELLPEQEP